MIRVPDELTTVSGPTHSSDVDDNRGDTELRPPVTITPSGLRVLRYYYVGDGDDLSEYRERRSTAVQEKISGPVLID